MSTVDFSHDDQFMAGRRLYDTTEKSNVCKKCINDDNIFCPTANLVSGYCCLATENCPQSSLCSDSLPTKELQYMLCPNEEGCSFARTLRPTSDGLEVLYEQVYGEFLKGDLCSFKISIPTATDLNDIMKLRVEYLARTKAVLFKGKTLSEPFARYDLKADQVYTATQGVNFFLLFQATSIESGDFVFSLWYETVPGGGSTEPTE